MVESDSETEDSDRNNVEDVDAEESDDTSIAAKLSNTEVKNKLISKEFKSVANSKGKSAVWLMFNQVLDGKSTYTGFAQCKKCAELLRCVSKTGTSSLNRHTSSCTRSPTAASQTPSIKQFGFVKQTDKPADSSKAKKLLTNALVDFCAEDLRSFNSVNGSGFQKLLNTAIEIGARFGKLSAESIIPDRTTISRNVVAKAIVVKERVKNELTPVFREVGGALTIDFWTDDHTKCSYFALTAHYIDNWKLKSTLLGIYDWDDKVQKTGDNIRQIMMLKLVEFGLDEDVIATKAVFVTDQGSNLIKALRYYKRLNCSCHLINLVMRNVFKDADQLEQQETTDDDGTDEILQCVKSCKDLVTYLLQSNLRHRITGSIKQDVETRWYSKVDLMASVLENWTELYTLLEEKGALNRLLTIDKILLQKLLDVLKPFRGAILTLEATKSPTLHLVWLLHHDLVEGLRRNSTDPVPIASMKKKLSDELQRKFTLDSFHKAATFMHPSFKRLHSISSFFEKQEVEQYVKDLLLIPSPAILEEQATTRNLFNPPPAKRCATDALFEKYGSATSREGAYNHDNELEQYMREEPGRIIDILEWWKNVSPKYPKLSTLARKLFAIPASSAASESAFSAAGRTITDLRSRLSPETVNAILFIHYNSR